MAAGGDDVDTVLCLKRLLELEHQFVARRELGLGDRPGIQRCSALPAKIAPLIRTAPRARFIEP
jgi:hypothetical protein